MKALPLPRFLKARRLELGLTQNAVARTVGVTRTALSRYESGAREVPRTLMYALGAALEVDAAHLEAMRPRVARASISRVRERAPLTPMQGRLSDVRSLPQMRNCHDSVHAHLEDGCYAELDTAFLRQTPYEAAMALRAVDEGAQPIWISPLEAGSRLLVVGDDKREYEGHLLRLGLLWEEQGERIVLLPQVPLLISRIDKRYRVDYLALHQLARGPAVNVVVELDGASHETTRVHDELRAEDLRLPLVRFDNRAVCQPEFWSRLVEAIREKAASARVGNSEYARFIRSRRRRYEKRDPQPTRSLRSEGA